MRLGIAVKMFLVLLATNVLLVVGMGLAVRAAFTRGFVGYLNEQGEERLEALMPRVEAGYAERGSWQFVRDDPGEWFQLIHPRPKERAAGPLPELPMHALTGEDLRLFLLDEQRQIILGPYKTTEVALLERPISGPDGAVVGYLAMIPFESVTAPADLRFQQQQLTASWTIAVVAVVLAVLIAFATSRTVVAPLRRIASATHELAQGNRELRLPVKSSDEVGQLSSDFNALADTLSRTEAARRAFMADISHELRTPLSVLRGEIEAIQDGVRPCNVKTIASLYAEVGRVSALVDDLYQLALSDAGALHFEMVDTDVVSLVDRMLDDSRPRFERHDLALERDFPEHIPRVHADPRRLQLLVGNLLENTLRYTDPGGRLRVRMARSKGMLNIEIQDSAPGVDAELRERLFERFFRAEPSRSRETGGAGLGLAICRAIVDAHGGSIRAEDSPLGGLSVVISLPVGEGEA